MQWQTQWEEYLNSKPDNPIVNTGGSEYFMKYKCVLSASTDHEQTTCRNSLICIYSLHLFFFKEAADSYIYHFIVLQFTYALISEEGFAGWEWGNRLQLRF